MSLTSQQKLSYEKNGFLVIPDFVSAAECDALVREADGLVGDFEPGENRTLFSTIDQERVSNEYFLRSADKISFFFEPKAFSAEGELRQAKHLSINKIGHAIHDLNPVFSEFSRNPGLASICEDLGLLDPVLMQSMYIFKQPRIGGEVTCHQDGSFLFTEPLNGVGLWFALQDANVSNGCLYALPGGHRISLKRRFRLNGQGGVVFDELDTSPWPNEGFVPLEVKKGGMVILHPLSPHLSGPNVSDFSRHAYTLHVVDRRSYYPSDNWLQRCEPARGF